jgi:hypothetical protein
MGVETRKGGFTHAEHATQTPTGQLWNSIWRNRGDIGGGIEIAIDENGGGMYQRGYSGWVSLESCRHDGETIDETLARELALLRRWFKLT